jgi:hypothetical protein
VVNRKAVRPAILSLDGASYNERELLAYLKERVRRLLIVDGDAVCERWRLL